MSRHQRSSRYWRRVAAAVAVFLCLIMSGWHLENILRNELERGLSALENAIENARGGDFTQSRKDLERSREIFARGAFWLKPIGLIPKGCSGFPGCSHLLAAEAVFSSGSNGIEAALIGLSLVEKVSPANGLFGNDALSMLDLFESTKLDASRVHAHLVRVEQSVSRINSAVVPSEFQERFHMLDTSLPLAIALLGNYVEHQSLFTEMLGAHGPRTYLFLFQNNHELRATGGFIGSYALLDVNAGKLRRFFVDGIFNPDGQLKENIVPPKPIQKISAGWSLHDSNWFPDFPASAEKAMFFYEKTGGPTVDGIITLTPEVLRRLLEQVGPVELPEYGVTIDAGNFISAIQEEVEVNYDKEENEPKRILGDLTEVLLQRFLSFDHPKETWQLGNSLADLLNERHILIYSRNPDMQRLVRAAGWSGEVLSAPHDYLSVIHSNINGYKTDGVIDESIVHEVEIEPDGRVIDTVSITRRHGGGQTPYEWWNKVNADYLRVYVPEGSKLLSAEGMTREFPEPPLDYAALGFRRDADIEREERETKIDEPTGTRISTDAGKTVFGNWVYVSPGESVTVRYTYELPFRVAPHSGTSGEVSGYSALYQKQSGSNGSKLEASIRYPEALKPVWQTPENLIPYQRTFQTERTLSRDFYWGVVFGKEAGPEL